jgi:hypothetical protein
MILEPTCYSTFLTSPQFLAFEWQPQLLDICVDVCASSSLDPATDDSSLKIPSGTHHHRRHGLYQSFEKAS